MVKVRVSKKDSKRVYEGFVEFPPMSELKAEAMVSYHKSQGAEVRREGDEVTIDYFTPTLNAHRRGRALARRAQRAFVR